MHSIETIDRLLIDELSATETYQQVMEIFGKLSHRAKQRI